jgi:hypothetical protein
MVIMGHLRWLKVKFTLQPAMKALRESTSTDLLLPQPKHYIEVSALKVESYKFNI